MQNLVDIIAKITNTSDCIVKPGTFDKPITELEHSLPTDLEKFYLLSDGIVFYDSSEYRMEIVPHHEFVLANPIMLIGLSEEELTSIKNDISWSWYIIGKGETGEHIVIDLDPKRIGQCYYGFWDSYAMKGYMPTIATSFTDLLIRLLENEGKMWYWENETFNLGDAYDTL